MASRSASFLTRYLPKWVFAITPQVSGRAHAASGSSSPDTSANDADPSTVTKLCGTDSSSQTHAKTRAHFLELDESEFDVDEVEQPSEVNDKPIVRIGRFEIRRLIGAGGMGSVYLADDALLNRKVAIKIPHQHSLMNRKVLQRFHQEATSAAQLRHPNLIGVYETGVSGGTPYIAAEYIEGPSLAQWMRLRTRPVDIMEAASLIESLADAMQYAHELGILHRDLKPGNILLQLRDPHADEMCLESLAGYLARITDFGLARMDEQDYVLTEPGQPLGSAGYASPEQAAARHDEVSFPSDVFSLGVILYELLTGRRAFARTSIGATHLALETETPKRPRAIRSEIPRDLDAICMKCLEKQIGKRYENAAALRDDLRRFASGHPTIARPVPILEELHRWSRRSPSTAALVFVCVASLVIGVWGLSIYSSRLLSHETQLSSALAKSIEERARADRLLQEARLAQAKALRQEQLARQLVYETDMQQAYRFYEQKRLASTRRLLDNYPLVGYPTDHRDLSWKWLDAQLRARYLIVAHHQGPATEVAVDPSTGDFWSVGTDGILRRFDFQRGIEIDQIDLNAGSLHALAITYDGSEIAVGVTQSKHGLNGVVFVDPKTKSQSHEIEGAPTTVETLAWTRDADWLALGARYGHTFLWKRGQGITRTMATGTRNLHIAIRGDTHQLLLPNEEEFVSFDVETGEVVQRIGDGDWRLLFDVSIDGNLLAYRRSNKKFIRVGRISPKWEQTQLLEDAVGVAESIAFNRDATQVSMANGDGIVQTWAIKNASTIDARVDAENSAPASPLHTDALHDGPCMSIAYLDDQWLVSAGEDGRIITYNPTGTPTSPIVSPDLAVVDFCCSRNGRRIYVLDCDARLVVLDRDPESPFAWSQTASFATTGNDQIGPSPNWRSLSKIDTAGDEQWLAVSRDESRAVACNDIGRIAVIDLQSQASITHFHTGIEPYASELITSIAISPDGRLVAATCSNRWLHVWSVDDGKKVFLREFTDSGEIVSFSHDGRWLLAGGNYEKTELFSTNDFELKWVVEAGDGTRCGIFLQDSATLVTGHRDSSIRVWDIDSGSQLAVLHGHEAEVSELAASYDQKTLISIDESNSSRMWSLRDFHEIGKLGFPLNGQRVYRIGLSKDEDQVITMVNNVDEHLTLHAVRFDAAP
ncbi:serine/threonine-protein kinase [Aporhodopirellula aestuarii]|uniref:Serine/threonine-protein kinase n=1 Tax=Aporhodopirellula aestuarii TaxID=2950107 RepID=A0ABT0U3R1_9BACT|nr:serine/threonine-protein kinase [Aporhodopirellula aestuarii]MCM2371304.1 serine/threonine-protein kinase [Aporhodopirellula aestuarii]